MNLNKIIEKSKLYPKNILLHTGKKYDNSGQIIAY